MVLLFNAKYKLVDHLVSFRLHPSTLSIFIVVVIPPSSSSSPIDHCYGHCILFNYIIQTYAYNRLYIYMYTHVFVCESWNYWIFILQWHYITLNLGLWFYPSRSCCCCFSSAIILWIITVREVNDSKTLPEGKFYIVEYNASESI